MAHNSALRDFRRQADAVRSIPLEEVLSRWGAQPEPRDRSQWRTGRGPLSITGAKFFNWHLHQGGGGAIDLVMHLSGWDARAAVLWLDQQLGSASAALAAQTDSIPHACRSLPSPRSPMSDAAQCEAIKLRLPTSNLAKLDRVRRYLTQQRHLAAHLLEPLIDAGRLYSDRRGNAIFLMVAGKDNHAIGAELRGTGQRTWHGLAPGTRRDFGYFWIGAAGSEKIVLCESAIDAISCFQIHCMKLHTACICISTAGVRSNPPWLVPLLARGYDIYCGFDVDGPGEAASRRMILLHSSIKRLPPPAHDWNDALASSH